LLYFWLDFLFLIYLLISSWILKVDTFHINLPFIWFSPINFFFRNMPISNSLSLFLFKVSHCIIQVWNFIDLYIFCLGVLISGKVIGERPPFYLCYSYLREPTHVIWLMLEGALLFPSLLYMFDVLLVNW